MTDEEKMAVKEECKKFILKDENLSKKCNSCTAEDQEWIFKYLSTGKGITPYELITRFDSLEISLEEAIFSFVTAFTLALKKS